MVSLFAFALILTFTNGALITKIESTNNKIINLNDDYLHFTLTLARQKKPKAAEQQEIYNMLSLSFKNQYFCDITMAGLDIPSTELKCTNTTCSLRIDTERIKRRTRGSADTQLTFTLDYLYSCFR